MDETVHTTTTPAQTGVDKIIAHLQANRDNIGAIIVGAIPLPGKKLTSIEDPSKTGNILFFGNDLIMANSQEERESPCIASMITQAIYKRMAGHHGEKKSLSDLLG